jgi:hypothetical protein
MSKNFKFYCPAEISKAKDTEGNTVMKMGGIASTIDEDSDGEFLDPNGFIIDEFLELGLVNWHHQAKDSPMSVIGEPTLAEIRPEGFYVECELYKSSAMAKEVYELGETMQKDSRKRRLGFSIEGSVIERESDDKTSPLYYKIKKALITGLAITHMPKNAKTFADIIKGKGTAKIGEGEDEDDEIEKDLSTTSGAAIVKESLDKNLKVTTFKSKYTFIECSEEKMFDKIFLSFPNISIEKAEKINELLTKIKEGMKSSSDSEMDTKIEKAMDILGFNAKEANPFIEKAKDDAEDLTPEQIATMMDEKIYGEDSKVVVDSDKTPKAVEEEEEEEEEASTEKLEKSILSFILKSSNKASKENGALGVLLKANLDQNAIMKAQFSEQSEKLEKAMETISLLKTQIGGTSVGRKSIIKARPIEKESFQKAQEVNILNSSTVLSKSRDYAQVLDLVDKYCDQENMRADLSKAVMDFEGSKILPTEVASEIKMKFGITIVD